MSHHSLTSAVEETSPEEMERVFAAAAAAWRQPHRPAARVRWLRSIADALERSGDTLVPLAISESSLPKGRLTGELARTVFQARLFADRLESGRLLPPVVDPADATWPMGPRPDLRRGFVPIGPVLVFAASNFPFAFSVAGVDTDRTLAAGCPVIVKAHPGHPELSRAVAALIREALTESGAPGGMFALIEGMETGRQAIVDRRIKAAGFTGSLLGGRALFDLAGSRPDPIPFYGELGSTNPVIVTPAAWRTRAAEIVAGFVDSFTLGCGQFCTQPGVVFLPDPAGLVANVRLPSTHAMLNDRIREGYQQGIAELGAYPGIRPLLVGEEGAGPAPTLFGTTIAEVLDQPELITTEVFGPASVLVGYESIEDVSRALELIDGALTCTIQAAVELDQDAVAVSSVAARIAGRVVWNQWPTGVTVSDAQQHGGPWPATTAPTTTSVGTAAVQRFARPVAYQNLPDWALPSGLRTP